MGTMMGHEVKQIGIVGSGQMGSGIAQVLAQCGFQVSLMDVREEGLKKGLAGIEKGLSKLIEKGKISEPLSEVMGRLRTTTKVEDLAPCGLVIEAVNEDEGLKKSIFQNLDALLPEHSIIATNTSSLPITKLAAYTKRSDSFIGMHFMNPVPLMSLVEIIRGHCTSDETCAVVRGVVEKTGKTTVCSQDYPGFIVNRILIPMINEAFFVLMEGVASAEDIDAAMKLGTNQPMGPLALADLIGLDTCLAIMKVIHDGTGDAKYRACPLLKKYVDAGLLGRKSAAGVYKY
jgi:3-hydroxybutyryl-CoA dehydrogenase